MRRYKDEERRVGETVERLNLFTHWFTLICLVTTIAL